MQYFCIFNGSHLESLGGQRVLSKEQSQRSMCASFGECFRKLTIATFIFSTIDRMSGSTEAKSSEEDKYSATLADTQVVQSGLSISLGSKSRV